MAFCTIALVLHITNLHIQLQFGGNFFSTESWFHIPAKWLPSIYRYPWTVQGGKFSKLTIYSGYFVFFHLLGNQLTCERYNSYIVPRTCFYGYQIACNKLQVVYIAKEILAVFLNRTSTMSKSPFPAMSFSQSVA
jgi:hypothetical protein